MSRSALATSLALVLVALASPAWAQLDPCQSDRPSLGVGPVPVSLLDGQLALPRRACPRSELVLGGDLYLVAELAEFYGDLRVNAALSGSWAITDRTEVFMSLEVFRLQTVISSITASYLGTGYLSLGALQQLWSGHGVVLAYAGRLVLPTTSGLDENSKPLALDSGVNVAWAPHRTVRVQGALTLAGSLGVSDGPAVPRGGVFLNAGVDWHPLRWLAVVVELNAGFAYRGAVDVVSVAGAFRFALGSHVGLELGAVYPFAGAERGLIAGGLSLSWRFDGQPRGGVSDEPAPLVEEPAPQVEEPAPQVEEPAPAVEEPAPVEEPTPAVEEPAPAVEEPASAVEEPGLE